MHPSLSHMFTCRRQLYILQTCSYIPLFYSIQGTVDLDAEAEKLPSFPQAIRLRQLAVEKTILLESSNVEECIVDLIGTYFCFDIAYPRQLYSDLLFIQHLQCYCSGRCFR